MFSVWLRSYSVVSLFFHLESFHYILTLKRKRSFLCKKYFINFNNTFVNALKNISFLFKTCIYSFVILRWNKQCFHKNSIFKFIWLRLISHNHLFVINIAPSLFVVLYIILPFLRLHFIYIFFLSMSYCLVIWSW